MKESRSPRRLIHVLGYLVIGVTDVSCADQNVLVVFFTASSASKVVMATFTRNHCRSLMSDDLDEVGLVNCVISKGRMLYSQMSFVLASV